MSDLISREAVLKLILSGRVGDDSHFECPEECNSMLEWAADEVAKMPTAEKVGKWIPFTKRELTAEEQEEHPEWSYIMECPLPDDGQEILVSNGRWVWKDEFCVDDGCYLDSDHELEGCAWMPLPKPWKGEEG